MMMKIILIGYLTRIFHNGIISEEKTRKKINDENETTTDKPQRQQVQLITTAHYTLYD